MNRPPKSVSLDSASGHAVQDVDATLAAWRLDGADRANPVRFRLIESLARRAAVQQGAARQRLDARLAELVAAYGRALASAPAADAVVSQPALDAPTPIAALLEALAQGARRPAPGAEEEPLAAGDAGREPPPDLKTLRYFRGAWAGLHADRRLHQSLAKVPDHAGPLNSHHLVYRALTLMRETSPDYLNRFMAYADGLLSMEQLQASVAPPAAAAARKQSTPRKPARAARRGRTG